MLFVVAIFLPVAGVVFVSFEDQIIRDHNNLMVMTIYMILETRGSALRAPGGIASEP